jgi:hypothetical protein
MRPSGVDEAFLAHAKAVVPIAQRSQLVLKAIKSPIRAVTRGSGFLCHTPARKGLQAGMPRQRRAGTPIPVAVEPTEFSGEPKPDPGAPIGNPFAACPTPTFGALIAPSPGWDGAVFDPVVAASRCCCTAFAVFDCWTL